MRLKDYIRSNVCVTGLLLAPIRESVVQVFGRDFLARFIR